MGRKSQDQLANDAMAVLIDKLNEAPVPDIGPLEDDDECESQHKITDEDLF